MATDGPWALADGLALRALLGLVLAAGIAFLAWRTRALARSGAFAATIVGAVCAMAGWDWALLLIAFFLTSTAIGRIQRDRRAARTGRVVAKGGARDAGQVLANGGVFAAAALGYSLSPSPAWLAAGAGALASASSDTWATEIGSLSGTDPVHVITRQRVTPGTSGAITPVGMLAALAGSLFIGLVETLLLWPSSVVFATVVGGFAGSLADTALGAAVQVRRWCDRCDSATEQPMHVCGASTRIVGGVRWIDNDTVNLLSVIIGAAVALLLFAAQGFRSSP